MTPQAWVIIGWLGSALALGSYAVSTRTRRPVVFHLGNTVGSVLLAAYEITVRAWPPLFLSVSFGAIGLVGLVYSSSHERQFLTRWTVDHAVSIILSLVTLTLGMAFYAFWIDKKH